MNEDLMLSVIVITYNQEKYISQTLDSILNQEHDYKYEIVIGEDCSKDGTRKIVEEYAAKYPNIIKPFYNNPNKGLIKNYFETIAHCKGKYIMDVAGDDWWLPCKVKTQIEFMESNPDVGMCYGKAKQFLQRKNKIIRKEIGSKTENFKELIHGDGVPALTICMKRNVFEKYFEEVNPVEKDWPMEDYPMWLWFSLKSKIHFIPVFFAVYRLLDNSLSHFNSSDESAIMFSKSITDCKNFFLMKYKKQEPIKFDIHKELAWKKAINSFYKRKDVLYEIENALTMTKKDKILLWICKNPFLFMLLRTYYRLSGQMRNREINEVEIVNNV